MFKRHIDGDRTTIDFFEKLKENALLMKEAIASENIGRIAKVLNKDWQTRKAMLPAMTTLEIEQLTKEVFRHGALAFRVCGAGGGGCAVLLIDPDKRTELSSLIEAMGMKILPANPVREFAQGYARIKPSDPTVKPSPRQARLWRSKPTRDAFSNGVKISETGVLVESH